MINETFLYTFVCVIFFCFIAKFLFWLKIKRSASYFLKSFFRWYSHHDFIHDSSPEKTLFMKGSNIINCIWWSAFMLLIIVSGLLHLLAFDSNAG